MTAGRPRFRTTSITLLAVLALLVAGCERSEPDTPAATLPDPSPADSPDPTPTPTPEEPSPDPATYAIPDDPADLTADYFEQVLQALYSLEGEAVRLMIEAGEVTEEAESILRAIYHPEQQDLRIDLYSERAEAGFPGTVEKPGPIRLAISDVISADEECAFVRGLRDFSRVESEPRDRTGEKDFFQLLAEKDLHDPGGPNPTPWVIGGSVIRQDGSEPDDPCVMS